MKLTGYGRVNADCLWLSNADVDVLLTRAHGRPAAAAAADDDDSDVLLPRFSTFNSAQPEDIDNNVCFIL